MCMQWLEGHKKLGTKLSTTKKKNKITTIISVSFINVWKIENQHPIRNFWSSKRSGQEEVQRRRLGFKFLQEEQHVFNRILAITRNKKQSFDTIRFKRNGKFKKLVPLSVLNSTNDKNILWFLIFWIFLFYWNKDYHHNVMWKIST
jgi:hypothetical protein